MWPNPHETVDLVTFSEELVNGKLRLLFSVPQNIWSEGLRAFKTTALSKNDLVSNANRSLQLLLT